MRVRVTLPLEDAQKLVFPEGKDEGPSKAPKAVPTPAKAAVVDDDVETRKGGKAKGKKGRAKGKTKYDESDSEDEAPAPKAAKKGKASKHQELEPETESKVKEPETTEKRVPLKELLLEGAEVVEGQQAETAAGWEATLLIDPGQFRIMNEILQRECKGRGRIDVEVGGVGAGGTN